MAINASERITQFYVQKMVDATKQRAKQYSVRMGEGSDIPVKSEILLGNPAEKILEYAEKENIGLIVMATHGRSGMTRWALGSVADKVVRATTRPVVLTRGKDSLPETREKGILNKILIPLDGSRNAEVVIPYIEELAARLKVEVILLQALVSGYQTLSDYVALTEEQLKSDKAAAIDHLDKIAAQLKKKSITVTTEVRLIIQEARAADEIIDFAGQIRADLIAMSTHGRSGVRRWVFGSVAERILREGNIPLLLVKPQPSL